MVCQLLCSRFHFIGHNYQPDSFGSHPLQSLPHSRIKTGLFRTVLRIPLQLITHCFFQFFLSRIRTKFPVDPFYTISDIVSKTNRRHRRQSCQFQCPSGSCLQICLCIEDGSIHVKRYYFDIAVFSTHTRIFVPF